MGTLPLHDVLLSYHSPQVKFLSLLFTLLIALFSSQAVVPSLSLVCKVQPQMPGVQPEVVPVAPSSQSVPVAPPQVHVVLHVLMTFKRQLNTN